MFNVYSWILDRKSKQGKWEVKLAILVLTNSWLLNLLMQIERKRKRVGLLGKPVWGFFASDEWLSCY